MLLAVYLPMVASLMFHVHERSVQEAAVCSLCASHTQRHGHLHDGNASDHHCLLCQLGTTLYVAAKELRMALPDSLFVVLPCKEKTGFQCLSRTVLNPRAPPRESVAAA